MERTITLDELGERSASDFLKEVAHAHETLCVVLEDGDALTIEPRLVASTSDRDALLLKPLPQFDIVIPEGWKEAVYEIG